MQAFIQATEFFSQGNKCLIYQVIPMFDRLDEELKKIAADESRHKTVRHAASNSSKILNKYYSLTDESEVYRVAMS